MNPEPKVLEPDHLHSFAYLKALQEYSLALLFNILPLILTVMKMLLILLFCW